MVLITPRSRHPNPLFAPSICLWKCKKTVQALACSWRDRGHRIGFGVGLAIGTATVGRIGYESRSDYTAIGSAVNLASRLCSSAADGEILADQNVAMPCRASAPAPPSILLAHAH
jgi:class 3 adenylate cyclase